MVVTGSAALLALYSRSTSSGSTATTQVGRGFLAHLQNIASKNYTALALEYANDATLRITATTVDHITTSGTQTGARNISSYWCSIIVCAGSLANVTIDNISYTVRFVADKVIVNATFIMNGNQNCPFQALLHVDAAYVTLNDKWLISQESWNVVFRYGGLCGGFSGR